MRLQVGASHREAGSSNYSSPVALCRTYYLNSEFLDCYWGYLHWVTRGARLFESSTFYLSCMAAVGSPFRSRKALLTPSVVFGRRSSASSHHESSPSGSTDLSDQSKLSEDGKGPLGLNLLCSVAEPLVDFIFVHGLGGGSRKTWAKSASTDDYWPRDWLRRDRDFKNVRVYSFGYKADWWEKDSILDIQDFARSLLGEMQDNPDIRRTEVRKDSAAFLAIC